MGADWITSPAGRKVLGYLTDPRPAWLWSADGELIWRNGAARLFPAGSGKAGMKAWAQAAPIRGQVSRLLRLCLRGWPTPSRVQFLAGGKPASATCVCSILPVASGIGLLMVAIDPIESALLAEHPLAAEPSGSLLPAGAEALVLDGSGLVTGGSPAALQRYSPLIARYGAPAAYGAESALPGETASNIRMTRLAAGPDGTSVLLFASPLPQAPAGAEAAKQHEREAGTVDAGSAAPGRAEPDATSLPPAAGPQSAEAPAEPAPSSEQPLAENGPARPRGLSRLLTRLADTSELFGALGPEDDMPPPRPAAAVSSTPPGSKGDDPDAEQDLPPAPLAAERGSGGAPHPEAVAHAMHPAQDQAVNAPVEAVALWRVTARGFQPSDAAQAEPNRVSAPAMNAGGGAAVRLPSPEDSLPLLLADPAGPGQAEQEPPQSDADLVERVSRYNFDELSRILTDGLGRRLRGGSAEGAGQDREPGALVNLGDETLVLNRLPLGILIFRDGQVLFANRAFTDLAGYANAAELRSAGLATLLPTSDDLGSSAASVSRLVRRDGATVPVAARLQSVSWQGRAALMLSAQGEEPRLDGEVVARYFAESLAAARGEGFALANRAGVIETVSPEAEALLQRPAASLVGKPLVQLVTPADLLRLKAFIERPARFADTERPVVTVGAAMPGLVFTVFTSGRAGLATGYFLFVHRPEPARAAVATANVNTGLLARLARALRRPLNTVLGFSDLIASAPSAAQGAGRPAEHARDIQAAGREIAGVIDEIEEFARLSEGDYKPMLTRFDLAEMLDACVGQVRAQASSARVFVRSAISTGLPSLLGDKTALSQAVLNLLASAIAQSPPGGKVVVSAQAEADGAVHIHVRDSSRKPGDLTEGILTYRPAPANGSPPLPVASGLGPALTRALLAVNGCVLSAGPTPAGATLFSVRIPPELSRAS